MRGFSFYLAEEVSFVNLHSLDTLILGDFSFMSAETLLIKSNEMKLVLRRSLKPDEFQLRLLIFSKSTASSYDT